MHCRLRTTGYSTSDITGFGLENWLGVWKFWQFSNVISIAPLKTNPRNMSKYFITRVQWLLDKRMSCNFNTEIAHGFGLYQSQVRFNKIWRGSRKGAIIAIFIQGKVDLSILTRIKPWAWGPSPSHACRGLINTGNCIRFFATQQQTVKVHHSYIPRNSPSLPSHFYAFLH